MSRAASATVASARTVAGCLVMISPAVSAVAMSRRAR